MMKEEIKEVKELIKIFKSTKSLWEVWGIRRANASKPFIKVTLKKPTLEEVEAIQNALKRQKIYDFELELNFES